MKKISLNVLECVVSETHCVITFIQFCESLVVCKLSLCFAFHCTRVVMKDTVYYKREIGGPEAHISHVIYHCYVPTAFNLLPYF